MYALDKIHYKTGAARTAPVTRQSVSEDRSAPGAFGRFPTPNKVPRSVINPVWAKLVKVEIDDFDPIDDETQIDWSAVQIADAELSSADLAHYKKVCAALEDVDI